MRRPNADHLSQPWLVHAIAEDFELLDVWRFPIQAERDEPFATFLEFMAHNQAELMSGSGPAAWLFRLRGGLGRIFEWDDEPDRNAAPTRDSLRHHIPPDEHTDAATQVRAAATALPFEPLYSTADESLAEIQNATVHALMHLGRVPSGTGWAPQMAVYVKRKGALGRFYMTLIGPFRHAIVYPAMMRSAERGWPRFLAARDDAPPE